MHILVVEDLNDSDCVLKNRLKSEGYVVDTCRDGETVLEKLEVGKYDAVILDVYLPKMNGFEVLEEIRRSGNQIPVMFLTALATTKKIVKGLDLGADEYVAKPYEIEEVLARIRVMLRKRTVTSENVYRCGSLEVNINERSVRRDGVEIPVALKEFSVLLFMIRNQNVVLTRKQIKMNVWSDETNIASNVVDVYIRFLRRKIDENFSEKLIHTVRGVGYIMKANEE